MKSDNQTVEFIVRAQQVFKGKLIGLTIYCAIDFPILLFFRLCLLSPRVSRFLPCSFPVSIQSCFDTSISIQVYSVEM